MPIQPIHVITEELSLPELNEVVAKLQKALNYILAGNLDSDNTREIGGWIISREDMLSADGDVGMSTTDTVGDDVRFWAGSASKDTAPWRVHKSGKMVATGALIQSSASSYPRIVFDPDGALVGAYASNDYFLEILSNGDTNSPVLHFQNGSDYADLYYTNTFNINSGVDMVISANDRVRLFSPGTVELSGSVVEIPNWSSLRSIGQNQTLTQYINGVVSGYSGIVVTSEYNFTFINGLLQTVT